MMYLAAFAVLASAQRSPIEASPEHFHECQQKGILSSKRLECEEWNCNELFGKDCTKVWEGLKDLPLIPKFWKWDPKSPLIKSYTYKNCNFKRTKNPFRWNMACRADFATLKEKCPLNPKITCKGVTAVEDTEERFAQMMDLRGWFGVKYDGLARADDEVAFDLECPAGSNAPFAVHTSNDMFVRFMATRDSDWQVATLATWDLHKIGCNRKLRPATLEGELKKWDLQRDNKCPGYKKVSDECVMHPARQVLWPEGGAALNRWSLSVSSMNFFDRNSIAEPETMAVVYKCKGVERQAWKNLPLLKKNEIWMLTGKNLVPGDASQPEDEFLIGQAIQAGLVKLSKRLWKNRCA